MAGERVANTDLLSLKGKVALITGGAMGIGYGIADRLTEAKAAVVISDINVESGRFATRQLGLPRNHFIQADVRNPDDIGRMLRHTVREFGGVDILVNNAGIYPFKPMLDMTIEEWEEIISTNLTSAFKVNQAAARQMVEQGRGGRIINIGSVDSLKPWKVGSAGYDASKAGIWGMSKSLALELAPHGITVNVVAPGDIDTPGSRTNGLIPTDLSSSKIPLGRRGTADDVAIEVLVLASRISDYTTGTIRVIDGGWMLTSSNTPT